MPNFGYNPYSGSGVGFHTPGQGAPVGGPLFYDTFTDTDSTALTAHTPDTDTTAAGWAYVGTGVEYDIISNRLRNRWDNGGGIGSGGTPWRELARAADVTGTAYEVSAIYNANSTTGGQAGIVVRLVDVNNWFLAYIIPGSSAFRLLESNAGTLTVRGSHTISGFSTSTNYTLKLVMDGDNFSGVLDGVEVWTYTSALHNTEATTGVLMNGADPRLDDFEVLE